MTHFNTGRREIHTLNITQLTWVCLCVWVHLCDSLCAPRMRLRWWECGLCVCVCAPIETDADYKGDWMVIKVPLDADSDRELCIVVLLLTCTPICFVHAPVPAHLHLHVCVQVSCLHVCTFCAYVQHRITMWAVLFLACTYLSLHAPVTVYIWVSERERGCITERQIEVSLRCLRVWCHISTSSVQPRTSAHTVHPSPQVWVR